METRKREIPCKEDASDDLVPLVNAIAVLGVFKTHRANPKKATESEANIAGMANPFWLWGASTL